VPRESLGYVPFVGSAPSKNDHPSKKSDPCCQFQSEKKKTDQAKFTCDSANFHGDNDAVGVADTETIFVFVPALVDVGVALIAPVLPVLPVLPLLVALPGFPEALQ
jgi:hypothetical protein